MKTNVNMPEVQTCAQSACAYNTGSECHARAITIGGGGAEHVCDTLMVSDEHTAREDTAGVGACKASNCLFNEDLECAAEDVKISATVGKAECLTYQAAS